MQGIVLSDIHSNTEMLSKIIKSIHNVLDFAIVLGDLTNFGDASARKILEKIKAKKCFAMPGNLDSWETMQEIESMGVSLHGKSVKLGKFILVGFGGGLHNNPGKVLFSEKEVSESIEPLLEKAGNALLATHLPPKNTALDLIHGGKHVGSEAIREAIEKFQPVLHLCGHIHEAEGEAKIGNTQCINIGAAKDGKALLLNLNENISFEKIRVGI